MIRIADIAPELTSLLILRSRLNTLLIGLYRTLVVPLVSLLVGLKQRQTDVIGESL